MLVDVEEREGRGQMGVLVKIPVPEEEGVIVVVEDENWRAIVEIGEEEKILEAGEGLGAIVFE